MNVKSMNRKSIGTFFGVSMPWMVALMLLLSVEFCAASSLDMTAYRGKVVVLDFWASWCVPCRRSFPWLNQMQEKYADQGLVIIGVNLDSDAAEARAFLQAYPANFEIVMDPDGDLAREYELIAMPSSFVLDRDGNIVKRHLGFKVKQQDEYEAALLDVLNAGRN